MKQTNLPNSSLSSFWNSQVGQLSGLPPLKLLERMFSLPQFDSWPNASGLNALKKKHCAELHNNFVCQNELEETELYYEQMIAEQNRIPTRPDNWHDLFNGLIWLLFPRTKELLNRWHVEDIKEHGLSPRTSRRNQITHFDECGVVLAVIKSDVPELLAQHRWHEAFVEKRHCWSDNVFPFVFGHANLEMLLSPFIGLTGKWLAIEVEPDFPSLPFDEQCRQLDELLYEQLLLNNFFSQKNQLKPIPLLGIPGWWDANKHPSFYQNSDYFRPIRR